MSQLSFKYEGLAVHWLEFSIEGLCDLEKLKELANFFHQKLKLNSTFRRSDERKSQSLISHPENIFNVLFVLTRLKYWSGTHLIF